MSQATQASNNLSSPARIPVGSAQLASCEAWHMPELQGPANIVTTAGHSGFDSQPEQAKDPLQEMLKGPMTASKLAAIQQQAQETGHNEGYQAGYAEGLAKAQADTQALQGRLNQILGHLAHPLAEQDKDLEQALVQLAALLAKQVVQQELVTDPELMGRIVRDAVGQLPEGAERLRILLHPTDVDRVQAFVTDNQGWQFLPDPSLQPGDCRVESATSYLDYSLDTQFRLAVQALFHAHQPQADAGGTEPSPPEGL